ncbi:hypothetical protein ONA92_26435 [Mycobacteroides salmoniphilum]|uniref:hypothetical protein n=1 Tax=Mycobacteroides salmoniphilum TaxID=404941 RepID=UPI00356957E8
MSIAEDVAQRLLAYLGRQEQLFGGSGPEPAPGPADQPRISDIQSGIESRPVEPHITSAPTYPMDQAGPYGPPDEDAPRMSDAQGGIHPGPDGPIIRSAPTYPMDDQ